MSKLELKKKIINTLNSLEEMRDEKVEINEDNFDACIRDLEEAFKLIKELK